MKTEQTYLQSLELNTSYAVVNEMIQTFVGTYSISELDSTITIDIHSFNEMAVKPMYFLASIIDFLPYLQGFYKNSNDTDTKDLYRKFESCCWIINDYIEPECAENFFDTIIPIYEDDKEHRASILGQARAYKKLYQFLYEQTESIYDSPFN